MDKFPKEEEEEEKEETNSGYLEQSDRFDFHLLQLSSLEKLPLFSDNSPWADEMVEKIRSCKSDLRFLKMVFLSVSTLEDTDDAEIRHILIPVSQHISTYKSLRFPSIKNTKHEMECWILDLQDEIQNCKQKFEESCEHLLSCPLRGDSSKNRTTLALLDAILQNLKDVYKFKTDDEIILVNTQIATLEKKVKLLHNLLDHLARVQWMDIMEMRPFEEVVHVFAQYSASLVYLYWVKAVDEDMATQLNLLLSNVLHMYRPCVTAFKAVYIRFFEELKSRQFDSLLLGQIIPIFLDLLLENLVDILKDDFLDFQESLMFVISFLAQPHDEHRGDEDWMMLWDEIEVLVQEDLYLVLSFHAMNGDFSEANTRLSDFTRNVEQVKGKILQAYDRIHDSILYDFPKTNGLGFFNFLLQNIGYLKEKLKGDPDLIPFAKYLIVKIEEELMSLRPYLHDCDNLKESEVIDLAYQTEYAINSCFITVYPLWYNMARLMKALDKLKDINSKPRKMEGRKTHDGAILHRSAISPSRILEGPSASSFNEVMVGLKEEAAKIVDNLIHGTKSLDIVAIVGMAGLGKTTMANKVYNTPAVRCHFEVFAYCIVSQVYSTRRILLDILSGIYGKDDKMYEMMEEDLADMLRKCLLGKRYLIVMDDIWDVKPWDDIKSSLPDNLNRSRVIFTTRNRNVALLAKEGCILHHLSFLSHQESWELLRKKAIQEKEDCPSDFLEVGKMIAQKCKGLPLTVILVAGLLRTERSLSRWNKISEAVSSHVMMETNMSSVLELSYQYLPEHLKPCFLYFGAFEEDKLIRVNKLMLLWIAEGFVRNSKWESLKNVGKYYLSDLVDRSLVIIVERSSYRGIKTCRVHDLVLQFCQRKAQEENVLQLMVGSNSSSSIPRNPYRVCINMKEKCDSDATNICPNIHSLLVSCKWKIRYRNRYDLSNLNFVQVMDLEDFDCDARFLREMQSVVHLRFMAISLSSKWSPTREFTLDNVISNWWNLEILILSGFRSGNFPEAIWNMTKLMHVYFNECYVSISGVKKREAYPYPQMVNLESFSSILVSSTEDLEFFLQRSPSLGKLSFRSTDDSIHLPTLDSLSRLESLKVDHVGHACLRSFNLVSSLKKLSLTDCDLDWRDLSLISEMPCLEVLKLLDDSFVGPKWDMDEYEFPMLRYLKLQKLDLVEWIADICSFPSLEVLIVDRCDKLNGIPPGFGDISTLKMIKVNALHKVVVSSVAEIEEAQKEGGNMKLQVMIEYDEE